MGALFNVLNGIYFLGWGVLFLVFCGLVAFLPDQQAEIDGGMKLVILATYLIGAAVLITVGVGLFMKRNWARIGAIALAAFALFGGLFASIGSYILRDVILDTPQQTSILGTMIIFLGIFFGIVPLTMIIFYCLKPARALFIDENAGQAEDRVPLGLRLLTVYFASSILGLGTIWFTPDYEAPVFFFWLWLSGDALKFFSAGMAVLHLYLAYGFYHLQKLAWKMCLVIYGYYTVYTAYSAVALDQAVMDRMYRMMGGAGEFMSVGILRLLHAFSLLLMVPLIVYIYRKREYFTN